MAIDPGVDNGPENTIIGGHVQQQQQQAQNGQSEQQTTASNSALGSRSQQPNKYRTAACRFFQKGKVCRAGDSCRFLHIAEPSSGAGNAQSARDIASVERPQSYHHDQNSESQSSGRGRGRGRGRNLEGNNNNNDECGKGKGRGKGKASSKGLQKGDSIRKTQIDELLRVSKWT
ncbi:hypothetical protein LPJ56_006038, partial [Coemansia sp. RSA 2599]